MHMSEKQKHETACDQRLTEQKGGKTHTMDKHSKTPEEKWNRERHKTLKQKVTRCNVKRRPNQEVKQIKDRKQDRNRFQSEEGSPVGSACRGCASLFCRMSFSYPALSGVKGGTRMTLENRTDRKSICKERYKKQDPYDRWLWNALKRAKLHVKKGRWFLMCFLCSFMMFHVSGVLQGCYFLVSFSWVLDGLDSKEFYI